MVHVILIITLYAVGVLIGTHAWLLCINLNIMKIKVAI